MRTYYRPSRNLGFSGGPIVALFVLPFYLLALLLVGAVTVVWFCTVLFIACARYPLFWVLLACGIVLWAVTS